MRFNSAWVLIYTKPKQERKVALQLQERNIPVLLPSTKVVRDWHDRKKVIDTPLFPSYVFVFIDKQDHYYNCLQCDGVLCFVRSGNEIVHIRPEVISNLKLITKDGEGIEVHDGYISPGRKQVIKTGIFSGLNCEVVEYKREEKIIVRIDLLNRIVLATLNSQVFFSIGILTSWMSFID